MSSASVECWSESEQENAGHARDVEPQVGAGAASTGVA